MPEMGWKNEKEKKTVLGVRKIRALFYLAQPRNGVKLCANGETHRKQAIADGL